MNDAKTKRRSKMLTSKLESGWMNMLMLTATLLLASACTTSVSDSAICDGSQSAREAHRQALLADGGPQSLESGADLLEMISAGCGK